MTETKRPTLKLKLAVKAIVPKPLSSKIVLNIESAASLFSSKPASAKTPSPTKAKSAPRKTASLSKKMNLMSNEEYKKLFKQVCAEYPRVFDINNKKIKIFAIGARQEAVVKLGWSPKTARDFFFIYCNGKKYKQARIKGANRYDLQGKVVGKVE